MLTIFSSRFLNVGEFLKGKKEISEQASVMSFYTRLKKIYTANAFCPHDKGEKMYRKLLNTSLSRRQKLTQPYFPVKRERNRRETERKRRSGVPGTLPHSGHT